MLDLVEHLADLAERNKVGGDAVEVELMLLETLDSRLELVGGHTGADQIQLALVDHRGGQLFRHGAEAERYHAARVGHDAVREQAGERAREAGGVERAGHAVTLGDLLYALHEILVLAVDDVIRAVLLRALERGVADVAADDGLYTLRLAGLEDDRADGAGAEDEDGVLRHNAAAAGAVAANSERLNERGILPRDLRRDDVALVFRHDHVLAPAAVDARTACADVLADVVAADLALVALAAGNDQIEDDVVARLYLRYLGADGLNDARVLVTRDARIGRARVLAEEVVYVRAAHAARLHFYQNVVVAGRLRLLYFADRKLMRFGDDDFFDHFHDALSL